MILFLKAHVSGYSRKDGAYVDPHETKAPSAKPKQAAFWQAPGAGKAPGGAHSSGGPAKKPAAWHPKKNDAGKPVPIASPHEPSPDAAWAAPHAVATVVPGGNVPAELHGVAFSPWVDAPTTIDEWASVPGTAEIDEPAFSIPKGKKPAAGVIIQEPDGRYWLVSPTNQFGGYKQVFPKGRVEDGLGLQQSAIKEAFEESGLQVEITGFLGDFERSQTYTRFYRARRVGGSPADMGWESQAVRLAPQAMLPALLNGAADQPIIAALSQPAL